MPAQFLHIMAVSRVSPKKATVKQWTVVDVAAEAARDPAACRHVVAVKPPVRILGVSPGDLPREVERRVTGATDAVGRRLRKDAKVLLAGVVSFPVPVAGIVGDRVATEVYRAWARASVTWLRQEYGSSLVSIVAHHDETHPNLHFYAVPEFLNGQTMAGIHPGMAAIARVEGGKREKDAAYREAMRSLQGRFWNDVGQRFGHARTSARPRRRWRRWEWNEITKRTSELESRLARVSTAYERLVEWTATAPAIGQTMDARARLRGRER